MAETLRFPRPPYLTSPRLGRRTRTVLYLSVCMLFIVVFSFFWAGIALSSFSFCAELHVGEPICFNSAQVRMHLTGEQK